MTTTTTAPLGHHGPWLNMPQGTLPRSCWCAFHPHPCRACDPLGSCSECGAPAPFDSSHAASWLDAETGAPLAATCGIRCGDRRAARLVAQDRHASCSCESEGRRRCAHFLCRGSEA